MKAIVCTKYGPPEVLKLEEQEKPVPKDNEVLIKIHATAATASDSIVRGFKLPFWHPIGLMMGLVIGFGKPKNPVLGMVLAGEVEAIGKDVTNYKVKDQVFGWTIKSAFKINFGTYAEYKCLPEDSFVALKPASASYEEAAAVVYGGMLALPFLKKGAIQPGNNVLIYGASGAIGTAALQLVKHMGAKVTGVCSTTNLEMVKALGADNVLDYTKDDLTESQVTYDFIFDAVGTKKVSPLKTQCKKRLAAKGKYISVDDGTPQNKPEDIVLIRQLLESGELKPVIDRTYSLDQMVEAHQYVDQGHKKGNVIIKI